MTRQFDSQSERRIARAVIWTERQSRTEAKRRRRLRAVPSGTLVGIVKSNIEHDTFGTVEVATGNDFDSSLTADTNRSYDVYNPFLKLWAGSEVRIQYTRLAGGEAKYNVVQHNSATRIICQAGAGGITAGSNGLCSNAEGRNGHYNDSYATVYSWTVNLDVGANVWLLAELVLKGLVTKFSQWEVYSADCPAS